MSPLPAKHITQGALIELLAAERPDSDALVYPDRGLRMTFSDLERRSLELARGLIASGVEPGERVTLWADNRPDWIPLQFALARIGAVLVTANTALAKPEIEFLLRQSRSAFVVAAKGRNGDEYRESLAALQDLPELRGWIELEAEPADGALGVAELVRSGESIDPDAVRARTAATRVDDPTNIQYTSGTTGFPKGVVLSHRNIVGNASMIGDLIDTRPGDKVLLQVPLFHCFGCVVVVLGAYTHGIPIVATETFDPVASLRAIHEEGCTLIHGVPTMFLALLSVPEFSELRPTTLRAGIMGGAPCPIPLMRRIVDEMGCAGMLAGYGMTEASPGITGSRPEDPLEIRCETVGHPMPGIEVKIVDPETGEERANGQRGELWARGPNIMLGYFEDETATRAALTEDGWLRTGDLATRDANGLVRIVGRIKEMIIRGGENVSPVEVEDALRKHANVQDAAVFGVPDERLGEEVMAAVIPRPDCALTEQELLSFLAPLLAPFKQPRLIALLDAFPLTPSGKVQKFKLAERFCPE